MSVVRRLLALLLPLGVLAAAPAPASALSCVGPTAVLRDAEQIVTGRFVEIVDERVRVEVVEVWRGGPVAEQLWLDLDLIGWWDRDVAAGEPDPDRLWVLVPFEGAINPCTAFAPTTPGVGRFEPARVTQPVAATEARGGWWERLVRRLIAVWSAAAQGT
jgi:hypothetical protein